MLFNSINFLLFFVTFCALWPFVRGRPRLRWAALAIGSFVFYGFDNDARWSSIASDRRSPCVCTRYQREAVSTR